MADTPLAQFLSHDPGQGTYAGFGDVRHPEGGGIQLVAGAHGADDGDARLRRLLHQGELGGDGVHRVHNIVILPQVKFPGGVRQVEEGMGANLAVGIDLRHPEPGSLGFFHAQGGMGSQDLTVQVGNAHSVLVDQVQLADACPGQGLHHIAAHASQSEDGHPGSLQPGDPFLSQQHGRAGILFLHAQSLLVFPLLYHTPTGIVNARICSPLGSRCFYQMGNTFF